MYTKSATRDTINPLTTEGILIMFWKFNINFDEAYIGQVLKNLSDWEMTCNSNTIVLLAHATVTCAVKLVSSGHLYTTRRCVLFTSTPGADEGEWPVYFCFPCNCIGYD